MIEKTFTVPNDFGIVARIAMVIVQSIVKTNAEVFIRKEDYEANAKEIMSILCLAAEKGDQITVIANGPDETIVIEKFQELVDHNFYEEEMMGSS